MERASCSSELNRLLALIDDLFESEDSTGCSDDLTVVSRDILNDIREIVRPCQHDFDFEAIKPAKDNPFALESKCRLCGKVGRVLVEDVEIEWRKERA